MILSRRAFAAGFCATVSGLLAASALRAADGPGPRLVMYRRAGCPWCAAWDREIGPAYPNTDLGRAMPLHQVDLDREGDGGYALVRPVRYTPTFVLAGGDGRELGRIEGYPGDEFFWVRLEAMAAQADSGAAGHREE